MVEEESRGGVVRLIEKFAAHEWPGALRVNVTEFSLDSETGIVRGFLLYGDAHRVYFETRIDRQGNILGYRFLPIKWSRK